MTGQTLTTRSPALAAITVVAIIILNSCDRSPAPPSPMTTAGKQMAGPVPVHFADMTAVSGLPVPNVSGSASQDHIIETMSAGAAFFDYDGDGWLDLLTINGTRLADPPPGSRNRLYRNDADADGNRVFREVTDEGGLGSAGWGMGCAIGDYDNDGDGDVYLTYWGPNELLRNDGSGLFTDVTAGSRVGDDGWGSSATFGDLNNDGILDLYVTNYLEYDLAAPPAGGRKGVFKGLKVFYGPKGVPPQADRLYRNAGSGRFEDVSERSGIAHRPYPGLGVTMGDYDSDGDLDIYVANDSEANQLYRNGGNWHFDDIGMMARVAFTEDGRPQAGMGVHGGDFDNDGDLDLFVTNFSEDVNTLYRNDGIWQFVDVTTRAGLDGVVRPLLGFGTAFFDYDNDGWLDLFVANGHLYPQLSQLAELEYAQRNLLYRNNRGRFVEAGTGAGVLREAVSRATAFGDYDNDGDVDLFVTNLNDTPSLLRNEGGNGNNWIGFELEGGPSNRDAIGATVRLSIDAGEQMRELHRGYGFQSSHDPRLLFGLGDFQGSVDVEISWPSGRVQAFKNLPSGRYLTMTEGEDRYAVHQPPADRPSKALGLGGAGRADLVSDPTRAGAATLDTARIRRPAALSPQELYDKGRSAYAAGRFGEAAAAMQQVVELDSRGDRAYLLLGKTYLNQDRNEEAIEALLRAHTLDPSNWEYANYLGVAYMRVGRDDAARESFRLAAINAAWAPRPHLNLARLYDDLGQPESAVVERQLFAVLQPLQRRVEVALDLQRANPDDHTAATNLGRAYADQGRLTEALEALERACHLDPGDSQAAGNLGEVLHRLGRTDEALEVYARALELAPESATIRTRLAITRASSGDRAGAIADLQEALRTDPHSGMAHFAMGELELERRDVAAALAACERATSYQPDFAAAHACVAKAWSAAGRYEEGIAAFQRALELDPHLTQARYALGVAHYMLKEYDSAAAQWLLVLQLKPDHVKARRGLSSLP